MKYAIYERVSTEDQAEKGNIQMQTDFAVKYCDLHQIEIYDFYKDDGITGTLPLQERPEGLKLIQDAQNKKFDTILIYKIDRLGRSARIIINAVYELETYGVKVKSMTEPFDTADPAGKFMLNMLAAVADLERETILSRMWQGANRAARQGKWLGGIVPYGYKVNDDKFLEINEEPISGFYMSEVEVISLMYSLLVDQGYSTVKIADYLNAIGVPPAYVKDNRKVLKGKRKENTSGIWRPSRVRNIIVNSTYKGIHIYGKRTNKQRDLIPREVPQIVSEEVWDKAQNMLHENQIDTMKNSKREYLLRGLIKCGCCGLTYIGKAFTGADREMTQYYVCGGKNAYKGPLNGECHSKNVLSSEIEALVWKDVVNFINNPGDAIKAITANLEDNKVLEESLIKERELIKDYLNEKERGRQNILDLYRKGIIKQDDVELQLTKISDESLSLNERLNDLESQISNEHLFKEKINNTEILLLDLKEKIKEDMCFAEKRDIVKTLVEKIIVETIPSPIPNGRPRAKYHIQYNFNGGIANFMNCTDMDSSMKLA